MSIVFQIRADNEVDQSKPTTRGHWFESVSWCLSFRLPNKFANNNESRYGLSHPHDVKNKNIIAWCIKMQIITISVYTSSTKNLKFLTYKTQTIKKKIYSIYKSTPFWWFSTNLLAALHFAGPPQKQNWGVTPGCGVWVSMAQQRWEGQGACHHPQTHNWHCWCHPHKKTH